MEKVSLIFINLLNIFNVLLVLLVWGSGDQGIFNIIFSQQQHVCMMFSCNIWSVLCSFKILIELNLVYKRVNLSISKIIINLTKICWNYRNFAQHMVILNKIIHLFSYFSSFIFVLIFLKTLLFTLSAVVYYGNEKAVFVEI